METIESNTAEVRIGMGQAGVAGQGPHMIIVLKVCLDRVVQARFSTYGCPAANACCQCVCEEVEGKTTDEASQIDEAFITRSIGAMPLGREHCPGLAVTALRLALDQVRNSAKGGLKQCP